MPTIGPNTGRSGATQTLWRRWPARGTGRLRVAFVVGLALVASACSDDDNGISTLPPTSGLTTTPATTERPATTPPTTDAPTTTAPPATTPDPPTTVAPTTTLSQAEEEERIKSEVASAYVAAFDEGVALGADPPGRRLVERVHQFTVPGSPASEELLTFLRRLLADGTRMDVSDDSLNRTQVENVELVGTAPYREAVVTHCTVLIEEEVRVNADGTVEPVSTNGLRSFRAQAVMRRTPNGWKRFERIEGLLDAWPGENRCDES